jgi:long-chain acyl-CoA synthetase
LRYVGPTEDKTRHEPATRPSDRLPAGEDRGRQPGCPPYHSMGAGMKRDAVDDGAAVENLASLLMSHPFAPGEPLLHTIERTVTAGEARERSFALARDLRDLGVLPGHAVAVQLPNGPEVVTTMTAIWLAKAIFVPVNPLLTGSEVERVFEQTGPSAVIDRAGLRLTGLSRRYENGTAFILWTSGTTGKPKPILHTHRGYSELIDRVLGPLRSGGQRSSRAPSPNLIPVSMALNAGIYNVLFGLRAGAPLVIMDRFLPDTFAELVRRFEIRSTVLPPAAIAMLNDDPGIRDLWPLQYVRSITAPLSPLQARRFSKRFQAFVLNSYGQAEIGEVIGWTASDAKLHPDKIGSIGKPHPGVAIKVVDDDGRTRGRNEIGELRVRPPTMAAGYASGEDLGDRIDDEGYVATGDLARVDNEDFVWIEGRLGDVINRGGNKVFPDEVEEVLRLSPAVRDVAVAGIPNERLGQVPVAFVVSDAELDADALTVLCREHLAPYKVPVDFRRIEVLPRNEVGKVLRIRLVASVDP